MVSQGRGDGHGVFFEKGLCNFPYCDQFLVAQSTHKFVFLGWSEGSNRLMVTDPFRTLWLSGMGKSSYGEGEPESTQTDLENFEIPWVSRV